jgi:hypothetical protein
MIFDVSGQRSGITTEKIVYTDTEFEKKNLKFLAIKIYELNLNKVKLLNS